MFVVKGSSDMKVFETRKIEDEDVRIDLGSIIAPRLSVSSFPPVPFISKNAEDIDDLDWSP